MKKRYPNKKRILLVNITRLGDMLQATPTIAGMKMENPGCHISVLVEKQFEQVCHHIPNIDEVISLDLGMTVRSLSREQDGIVDAYEYISIVVEDLRKKDFDYCLNMSSSAYTAILLRLIGVENKGGWASDEEGYRIIESEWARLFATSVFHKNRAYNSLNLVDVFRSSADIEHHPNQLLINVDDEALNFCRDLIDSAGFTNTGPLIAIQAGASQLKRQWAPRHFIQIINLLLEHENARIVLIGTKKELPVIEAIKQGCQSENVFIAAGKTNIPQVTAMLKLSDLLITGDTGPMHISVAVNTPVVAMFLASAYGFETGPYSEGNIILQPIIECGPCNPNKACARPDCHDQIPPELVAKLTALRLKEDFKQLPPDLLNVNSTIIYRSFFDEYGFCDLAQLNPVASDSLKSYRDAYRKLWLDDLGNFPIPAVEQKGLLNVHHEIKGLNQLVEYAQQGQQLIKELSELIVDPRSPVENLSKVNNSLTALDIEIENMGYHFEHLGPLSRMFIFSKENILGTDALDLASQMSSIYVDLERRANKLRMYFVV